MLVLVQVSLADEHFPARFKGTTRLGEEQNVSEACLIEDGEDAKVVTEVGAIDPFVGNASE